MTSYTTMYIARFHSSESLAGSLTPGRWRNCASVGAIVSGFAKPSSWSFSPTRVMPSGSDGCTLSSTRIGSMKPA